MNFKGIISFILIVLLTSCTVTLRQQDITSAPISPATLVTPVIGDASGVVYALPKTGLRFTVKAQKVEKKRGEFYLYSERYLGLKDVILEDATEWKIMDISVAPFGVANTEEMFQIISGARTASPLVHLSEDGVLLSVNSVLSLEEPKEKKKPLQVSSQVTIPYTEEMLLANSSAKMAQEAANYIYRLRESRTALLSADLDALPPDGEAYAMSLDKINVLEQQFLSLFKGQEIATCITETIEIVPDQIIDKEVLFRFSTFNGVVASNDVSGSPFFIKMEKGDFRAVQIATTDSAGLYYKLPAPVQVDVFDGSTEVLSKKILMAQFGQLQTLSPFLLNDDVKIQFYPSTGAIKSISK